MQKLIFLLATASLLSLSACKTVSTQQSQENYQTALIEKQITETDRKVDEIYHRVSVIQFMVDNHERAITDLQKLTTGEETVYGQPRQSTDVITIKKKLSPVSATTVTSESAQSLYNRAFAAYRKNDYSGGENLFRQIIRNHPEHDLADNALYWAGECLYALKKYQEAISTFNEVINKYPEGGKIPDALLKIGYAYVSIDDFDNGRYFLKKTVKNYPFSPAGTKAEVMLRRIKNK